MENVISHIKSYAKSFCSEGARVLKPLFESEGFNKIKNWRIRGSLGAAVACMSFWGGIVMVICAVEMSDIPFTLLSLTVFAGGLWITGAYDEDRPED